MNTDEHRSITRALGKPRPLLNTWPLAMTLKSVFLCTTIPQFLALPRRFFSSLTSAEMLAKPRRCKDESVLEVLTQQPFHSAELSAPNLIGWFSLCPWCLCGSVVVAALPRQVLCVLGVSVVHLWLRLCRARFICGLF